MVYIIQEALVEVAHALSFVATLLTLQKGLTKGKMKGIYHKRS